jgi:hypothetical protein
MNVMSSSHTSTPLGRTFTKPSLPFVMPILHLRCHSLRRAYNLPNCKCAMPSLTIIMPFRMPTLFLFGRNAIPLPIVTPHVKMPFLASTCHSPCQNAIPCDYNTIRCNLPFLAICHSSLPAFPPLCSLPFPTI